MSTLAAVVTLGVVEHICPSIVASAVLTCHTYRHFLRGYSSLRKSTREHIVHADSQGVPARRSNHSKTPLTIGTSDAPQPPMSRLHQAHCHAVSRCDVSYSRSRIMHLGGCIANMIGSPSTQQERITSGIPIYFQRIIQRGGPVVGLWPK